MQIEQLNKKIDDYKNQLESANKESLRLNDVVKDMKKELDTRKDRISELEKLVSDKASNKNDDNLFLGRLDQKALCGEIKDLLKENEDLKAYANEISTELEYGKQRENKLMYFLFLLQQKDYPVFEVFETYIKDLDTQRFSTELDEDYKHIYIQQMKRLKELGLLERE